MHQPTLFIFNPETDFARALANGIYTPTAPVAELKRRLALTPAHLGSEGDMVLISHAIGESDLIALPHFDEIKALGIRIIRESELKDADPDKIVPWGWDNTLTCFLCRHGVSSRLIPDEERIKTIRELSHRRISIAFHQKLSQASLSDYAHIPKEIFEVSQLKGILKEMPQAYLKAPWSSSGRGVIRTADYSLDKTLQWAGGIMRRQKSVIVEPAWAKTLDFASEWECERGQAHFIGYSVFSTKPGGGYLKNEIIPQSRLEHIIRQHTPLDINYIIDTQKIIIEELIAPHYDGPLGIDMLANSVDGRVNACVEVNLRLTMGRIAIERAARLR